MCSARLTVKHTASSVMSSSCYIALSGSHVPQDVEWICRDEKYRQLPDSDMAAIEKGVATGSSVSSTERDLDKSESPYKTRPEVTRKYILKQRQNINQALSKVGSVSGVGRVVWSVCWSQSLTICSPTSIQANTRDGPWGHVDGMIRDHFLGTNLERAHGGGIFIAHHFHTGDDFILVVSTLENLSFGFSNGQSMVFTDAKNDMASDQPPFTSFLCVDNMNNKVLLLVCVCAHASVCHVRVRRVCARVCACVGW